MIFVGRQPVDMPSLLEVLLVLLFEFFASRDYGQWRLWNRSYWILASHTLFAFCVVVPVPQIVTYTQRLPRYDADGE